LKKIIRTSTVALSLDVLLKGQLEYLNEYYEIIAVSGEDKNLETVRNREKVKTISVSMERNISILQDLNSLLNLYRVFKAEKPQIVHSITPKAGLLSMTAAYFAKVPIRMHTFTGLVFPYKTGRFQKLLIIMDKVLCKFATHIFPEGKGVMQDLQKYKITKKPLKIIANGNVNGIDVAHYNSDHFTEKQKTELRQSLKISEDSLVFVFVGRLVTDKGINELVEAFSTLQKEVSKNINLLLVGPFEDKLDPLKAHTKKEMEQNNAIITVGYQNDVRPFFAISDVLAFPSYREGFPNVVLQAGAMGLPSIVTDISGSNEIILQGINGLIIPKKSTFALQKEMQNLLNDKVLLKQLKTNARKQITNRFKQEVVFEAILKEYEDILKQKKLYA
jgi:glycosyltransferase involved in cell wall biosynthesis